MTPRPRRGRLLKAVCLLGALAVAPPAYARVVLVGIDGGSWNPSDPGVASGALPNLARLAERGATRPRSSWQPAPRSARSHSASSVLDLAPLVLHLAGQPLPDDLEGELPRAVLDPAWLEAHPVRRVPAAEPTRDAASDPQAGADEELSKRLRSLGYLE